MSGRVIRSIGPAAFLTLMLHAASAQVPAPSLLVADRDTDSIWLLRDCNSDSSIDAATEVRLYFSGANTAGTPGIANPSALTARPDGLVLVGDADSSGRHWLWLRDLNADGDALDANESGIYISSTNPAGYLFGFPSGAAFDDAGAAILSNSGSAFGADALYRCADTSSDGDANDADEAKEFCTTGLFGPGNGPYGPQELTLAADGAAFIRNSSPNLHGVWRLIDQNNDDDANDAGESAVFFDSSNASGIVPSAGFAIEPDRASPGAFFTTQVATGGVDQILSLRDVDLNQTANDADEATVVWSSAESGFNIVDVVSLPDGRLFVSGASGGHIIVLRDLDGDNDFDQPTERATFFTNSPLTLQVARQMAFLHAAADIDANFAVSADDIFAYLDRWFVQSGQTGPDLSADFDHNGIVSADDIFAFLDAWFNPTSGC